MEVFSKITRNILIGLVRFYQIGISPYLGPKCRYTPTCSQYMMEAINEWGALKGTWLGVKRIGRCHPWGKYGYDPVPTNEKKLCCNQTSTRIESHNQ